MFNWEAKSIDDLPEIASAVRAKVDFGEVVFVDALMGCGKTTFAKFLVAAFGGDMHEVSSPTFGLVKSYPLPDGKLFHHFDLYRLKEAEELFDIGFETYLTDNAVVYVEWPELLLEAFDVEGHHLKIFKREGARLFQLD